MNDLFATLSRAVEGAPAVALAAAFAWGVLSILLSPCHLASIPLIVGFIDKQGQTSTRRALLVSSLFATGMLLSIGIIGAVTAAAGRIVGNVGSWATYAVAVVLLAVGLFLLDVLPVPWSRPAQVGLKRRGPLVALALGLVLGIALGPCTFAFMAPMITVSFSLAATSMGYGILLLVAYGLGHCSVIVLAGTFTEVVQQYLNWNDRSGGAVVLKRICGVLIILGALYLLYAAP